MSILVRFALDFLLPFLILLCLWGVLDTILKKKFSNVFTNYPRVIFCATYILITSVLNWNILIGMLVGWMAQGTAWIVCLDATTETNDKDNDE